jgi:hypothetical protein
MNLGVGEGLGVPVTYKTLAMEPTKRTG